MKRNQFNERVGIAQSGKKSRNLSLDVIFSDWEIAATKTVENREGYLFK
jgi:hypothetical protein